MESLHSSPVPTPVFNFFAESSWIKAHKTGINLIQGVIYYSPNATELFNATFTGVIEKLDRYQRIKVMWETSMFQAPT